MRKQAGPASGEILANGKKRRSLTDWAAFAMCVLLMTAAGLTQETPSAKQPEFPLPQDFKKYPGLLDEVTQLQKKLHESVQFPAERSQSRLLPLLPETTTFYMAFPNYGDALHQALTVFQHEREQSAPLRDWWQHSDVAVVGPKVEEYLEKVSELSQYLGDEIVVSGAIDKSRKEPSLLILAEVKKPGLKDSLKQVVKELSGKSDPAVRVLDVQELGAASDKGSGQDIVFLVRPDFLIGALDVATLRRFNAQLDKGSMEFASTPFGRRVFQAYEGGTSMVGAIDFQKLIAQFAADAGPSWKTFQRTGFADAKYLVWEHKSLAGEAASQTELSFTGPRHGVASWLAAPAPMGSLDFVSPKAAMAAAMLLKNPADVYDDITELAVAANPNALTSIAQAEQGLKLSLRNDLFGHLGGEIAFEIDSFLPPAPIWKAILRVNDADLLQTTFAKLLAGPHIGVVQSEHDGLIYNTLQIPSGAKPTEIAYVFLDGYLVVGSSHETVAEAVRLHRSGESLGKSESFRAALPPGRLSDASALFYEDPVAVMALTLRQASPEMAKLLSETVTKQTPIVMSAYGEESALRSASRSAGVDVGALLVGAAIAIPNLLRARIAANEASAVGSIRTVNTAQVAYAADYPERGFARDLASLGPGLREPSTPSASHAALLDSTLANASCTAGKWCTKSGYRFILGPECKTQRCREYVVVATPVDSNAGTRSFCARSDAVVRFRSGPPLTVPISAAQCRTWAPLQ
jgi:hypothetical protein